MKIRIIICLFTVYCNPTFSQTLGTDQTIAPIYYNLSTIEGIKSIAKISLKTLKVVRIFKNFVLSEIVGVNTKNDADIMLMMMLLRFKRRQMKFIPFQKIRYIILF
jgi:hypothetical protein